MARTTYALPVDVLRRFDPTLTQSDLESDRLFDNEDEETILSRIEAVERKFDTETGHPFREVRIGTPDEPFSYEQHDADFRKYQGGVRVWLNSYPVVPLDSEAGDTLELRTGTDSWRDITDLEGDLYEANWREGTLTVYAHRYAGRWHHAALRKNVRITYRVGAFGGDIDEGGQTELAEDVTDADETELEVKDARRLPARGILNLGGREYVHLTDRDIESDTITVTRGVRHTSAADDLEEGDLVHYCPENIRDAIAAKAARDLIKVDHIGDNLPTPEDDFTFSDWLEDLEAEWEQAKAENAEATIV